MVGKLDKEMRRPSSSGRGGRARNHVVSASSMAAGLVVPYFGRKAMNLMHPSWGSGMAGSSTPAEFGSGGANRRTVRGRVGRRETEANYFTLVVVGVGDGSECINIGD